MALVIERFLLHLNVLCSPGNNGLIDFLSLQISRNQLNLHLHSSLNLVQFQSLRLQNKWPIKAVSRKKTADASAQDGSSEDGAVVKKKMAKASKKATTRTKKKATSDTSDENEALGSSDVDIDALASTDNKKKTSRKTRGKAKTAAAAATEEGQSDKKVGKKKKTKKKSDGADVQGSELNLSDVEPTFIAAKEGDQSEKKVVRKKKTKKKSDGADVQGSESDINDVVPTFIAAKEEGQSEKKVGRKKKTKKKSDDADVEGSESDLSDVVPTVIAAKEEDQSEKKVGKKKKTKKKSDGADVQDSESDLSDVVPTLIAAKEEDQSVKKVGRRKATKKMSDDAEVQGSESDLNDVESTIIAAVEDQSEQVRRTTKKTYDSADEQGSESDLSDVEFTFIANVDEESDDELDLGIDDEEDISSTYDWPPLVCCFGSAQHPFVPSGRPADRRVDYERYERLRDAVWIPEKFVRAPGGSAANVAIVLARVGGKVAFMGKLGDDYYGWKMVNYMNAKGVQTRSVCLDSRRSTAATKMKLPRRGNLRARTIKPCAEDSLLKSEINIDVLREAKIFYVSTHSLLDTNMRSTALRAIKIAKKLGALIFYDVNIPLPLWRSDEETRAFIEQVWSLADFIEVTNQELDYLYGIKPSEELDANPRAKYRFVNFDREAIEPLWRENLKVLFVTNGTSLIHYYTSEHYGAVRGGEDPPITPFTRDMSASGDGIVAGLMLMLTSQPTLITDNEYLKEAVQYAIETGFHEQWILERKRGYPPKQGTEVAPDENGIRSITERQYRTLEYVSPIEDTLESESLVEG